MSHFGISLRPQNRGIQQLFAFELHRGWQNAHLLIRLSAQVSVGSRSTEKVSLWRFTFRYSILSPMLGPIASDGIALPTE